MKTSSAVIAALFAISTVSAQSADTASADLPTAGTTAALPTAGTTAVYDTPTTVPTVPAGFNTDMADRITTAEAAVPSTFGFDAGNTNVNVNIDQAAIRDMMEVDRKFWTNNARQVEDLARDALEEPLERTKIRIAGAMASILKPASEALPLMMKMVPGAETCQVDVLFDCVQNLPRNERYDDIFGGFCAEKSECKPELSYAPWTDADDAAWQAFYANPPAAGGCCQISQWDSSCASFEYGPEGCTVLTSKSIGCTRGFWNESADYDGDGYCNSPQYENPANIPYRENDQQIQKKGEELTQAFGKLAQSVARDFQDGLRKKQEVIQEMAQGWIADTKRVLIDDLKCNAECINNTRADRFNPYEFANGKCDCQLPISPGQVVDWTAEDFSTISMSEWIQIHNESEQEVIEEIEMEEELTQLAATVPANGNTPSSPSAPANGNASEPPYVPVVDPKTPTPTNPATPVAGAATTPVTGAATTPVTGAATTPAADAAATEGGSGALWWVLGLLGGAGLVGGAVLYMRKQKTDEEGGSNDLYERFIDDETAN